MLKRQPSVEDAKLLSTYEANIKQKKRQMKAMAAELNMYQAQVFDFFVIESFNPFRSTSINMKMKD